MKKRIFGKTGLSVSVAGLGCGGFSRIGIEKGLEHAAGIVRLAIEKGVNFIDTAEVYGTEEAVGKGIQDFPRESIYLSTKYTYRTEDGLRTREQIEASLDNSLKRLKTDYVDILSPHAVRANEYEAAMEITLPAFESFRKKGKVRFLGITELFNSDTRHETLSLALEQEAFSSFMVGYNLLNPSAAKTLFPKTMEKGIGILCMFAVRNALSQPHRLAEILNQLHQRGEITDAGLQEKLDWLIGQGYAQTLPEAAYRFCANHPAMGVTLTGTSNPEHLLTNLECIQMPPLPAEALERLDHLFGRVDSVSGQ